jgi:RNA recognition motif-containing protein
MSTADPTPGPSRLPTITSEDEELAAESGIVVASASGADGADGIKTEAADEQENGAVHGENGAGAEMKSEEEEKVDPNALPAEACETLYLQNLNEKVRIPGEAIRPCLLFLLALGMLAKSRMRRSGPHVADLTVVMKETLALLFKPYRPVLPVVAHRNVRMRGQAFVSFADKETANRARREVNEFPLYGKAIVR